MQNLQYAIVSEEMVWIWYYDHLGSKHIKELLAREARDFIKTLQKVSTSQESKSTGEIQIEEQ